MKTRVEPAVQKAIKDSKGGEDGEEEGGTGGGSNLFKVEEFQLGSVKPNISNFKVHKAEDEDSKVWSPTHHLPFFASKLVFWEYFVPILGPFTSPGTSLLECMKPGKC